MKLFYGNSDALQFIPQNFKIYNFGSLKEIGIPLDLFPPNTLGAINEYDFDCKYANFIMSTEPIFINFMNLIMDLYNGIDVFILIQYDESSFFNTDNPAWNTLLIESFFKFIQQRYGINGTLINTNDDIESATDTEFADYGLFNLDLDKELWAYTTELGRIMAGGTPYGG